MDAIVEAINVVDAWVWGPPMIILLLGSHLYLTIRTKFIQRKLPLAIKLSVTPDPDAELFGKRAIRPYQVLYVLMAFLGAIGVGDLVWTMADIANAFMAVPNIIVVLLLSSPIARETRHYVWEKNLDEKDDTPIPTVSAK